MRMPAYVYAILAAGTILWCAPFPLFRTKREGAFTVDRRARWGIALLAVAYSLLWQGSFWTRSPEMWQVVAAILLLLLASLISWTAARAMGRQLRLDAAVDSKHELVRSGPYRWVRHPIYTSMLCVLLGTGLLVAPAYLLGASVAVFLIGTVIRMRVEDGLLASRFGEEFREYRSTVPRLIPFLI